MQIFKAFILLASALYAGVAATPVSKNQDIVKRQNPDILGQLDINNLSQILGTVKARLFWKRGNLVYAGREIPFGDLENSFYHRKTYSSELLLLLDLEEFHLPRSKRGTHNFVSTWPKIEKKPIARGKNFGGWCESFFWELYHQFLHRTLSSLFNPPTGSMVLTLHVTGNSSRL
ncbi:hypothetical protein B0H13DRAFT_1884932 [Mycena leptocephala]|nr:hypothetical protein B0H13DRAFT_1884932 [Mycena leptocephala]